MITTLGELVRLSTYERGRAPTTVEVSADVEERLLKEIDALNVAGFGSVLPPANHLMHVLGLKVKVKTGARIGWMVVY